MRRIAIGWLLWSLVSGSVASAQSLAEVARQEAERRKAIKTPSKLYTNEDLRRAPPVSVVSSAPADAARSQESKPTAAKPPAAPAADEQPPQDEAFWRKRITSARTELARNEVFLEALQSRVNALTTDFVNRDDPAQRSLIALDRQKALAEMENVRADMQRLAKAIADIEEEARRTGVPPGWLR